MSKIIVNLLRQRILVLDGGMGKMIQSYKLEESDFRGNRFADHSFFLKGNNDLLSITQPDIIGGIHNAFLDAGSDIIETNTFNSTAISQTDYGLKDIVYELNFEAAKIARKAADSKTKETPEKPRLVAGALGPTNRTATISPDVNEPGFRNVNFDTLVTAYTEALHGLILGGVDLVLVETIFDTLNSKAAIYAIHKYFNVNSMHLPVMISGTITDASGKTLSGQMPEAFWNSTAHARPISVGFNCALGADQLRQHIHTISAIANVNVSVYPNAGQPNEFGEYDHTPRYMATLIQEFADSGLVNIVGGCCGTTPDHISAIANAVSDKAPRIIPKSTPHCRLSGLEPLNFNEVSKFVNIGERTNVSGSVKFAKLIYEDKFNEALDIARDQVNGGAQIIDVNMDDTRLDGEASMTQFLNLIAAEPDISRVPVMLDSSKFSIIEAGLKCLQGKGIVNSISLKEGESVFISNATEILRYGAAVVVMAIDKNGPANTYNRKISISQRAYKILTETVGFAPEDIILDANIFPLATGIKKHKNSSRDFINAVGEIKKTMPHALTSGGLSNISLSFRGNNPMRAAINSVFLYHATKNGLDMAIVNTGQLAIYSELPQDFRNQIEDVVFNRRDDATERLLKVADGPTRQVQ